MALNPVMKSNRPSSAGVGHRMGFGLRSITGLERSMSSTSSFVFQYNFLIGTNRFIYNYYLEKPPSSSKARCLGQIPRDVLLASHGAKRHQTHQTHPSNTLGTERDWSTASLGHPLRAMPESPADSTTPTPKYLTHISPASQATGQPQATIGSRPLGPYPRPGMAWAGWVSFRYRDLRRSKIDARWTTRG